MVHFTVKLSADQDILFTVDKLWGDDDLQLIADEILGALPAAKILELNVGADILAIRFQEQNDYFELHIESYSESVWLTAADQQSVAGIPRLLAQLLP